MLIEKKRESAWSINHVCSQCRPYLDQTILFLKDCRYWGELVMMMMMMINILESNRITSKFLPGLTQIRWEQLRKEMSLIWGSDQRLALACTLTHWKSNRGQNWPSVCAELSGHWPQSDSAGGGGQPGLCSGRVWALCGWTRKLWTIFHGAGALARGKITPLNRPITRGLLLLLLPLLRLKVTRFFFFFLTDNANASKHVKILFPTDLQVRRWNWLRVTLNLKLCHQHDLKVEVRTGLRSMSADESNTNKTGLLNYCGWRH